MKTFRLFLTGILLLCCSVMQGQWVIDGINYDLDSNEKTARVMYQSSYSGDLVIPSSVVYNGETYSVTRIEDYAFAYCSGLTSLTVGNKVTSIGHHAFMHCSGLTSVNIPNSVTSIGDEAFYYCSGLTSVNIPNSVTSIGIDAFFYCSGLTSVNIPNSVTSIGDYAFYGCSGLTSVNIPNSVTSIGNSAFYGCSGLTSVNIPNSVTSIGSGAFDGCSGLTSIVVEDGNSVYDSREGCNAIVESSTHTLISGCKNTIIPNTVTSIGDDAFFYCSGLTSVEIPNSVTCIGNSAFSYCSGLTSVNIPNSVTSIGDNAFSYCSGLTSVNIPNSVTSIGNSAFYDCSVLTSVVIPNSVTSIGDNAFYNCYGLESITSLNPTPPTILSSTFYNYDATLYVPFGAKAAYSAADYWENFASIEEFKNFEVDGIYYNILSSTDMMVEVTYKGESPSSEDEYSGSVIVPATVTYSGITYSVTSIGAHAFYNCSGLTSVVIPNSVTSIEYGAFCDCDGLTSVKIGSGVTSIGNGAFSNCDVLTSIIVEDGNSVYDSREGCNAIVESGTHTLISGCKKTIIPNSVTSIGAYAFYACSGLTSVNIPNSVTSIGYYAFSHCYGLTSVAIPNSVTNIDYYAFYWCSGLTSVNIPNSVTSIGGSAFAGCNNLKSITSLNPTPPTIGGGDAFYQCYDATLYVPSGAKAAYSAADYWKNFANIEEFKNFEVDGIYYNILSSTDVEVTYKGESPSSVVEYSGSVIVPATVTYSGITYSVTSIGDGAFYECSGLTSVNIPNSVTSIGEYAFYLCSRLTFVNIPNSVTCIEDYAFCWCSGLTSVNIPNSVTSIGDGAFYLCFGLTSVNIPNSVTSIGDDAFSYCRNLTSVEIPNSVTSIGDGAFRYCTGLTSIVVEDGNSVYDSREGCNAIVESGTHTLIFGCNNTIIPNSVTSIGDGAFRGCDNLTSVKIPNSVTSIGEYAFNGCSGLSFVEIPNSVTSIGEYAFNGCSGLTSVEMGSGVTSIGDYAFYGCSSLESITSLNPTPPTMVSVDAFDHYNATLYVPYGAKAAYSAADYWKNFANIEELAPSIYELKDGVAYTQQTDTLVNVVNYTRKLPNLYWNALYLPFELPYDVIEEGYEVAYINDVNGSDTDDDGDIDDLAMEIIKIKGGTLKANYPYLIKAKTEADRAVSIMVEDAVLYAAEENSVDCSSVYQKYAVTGIYTKKTAAELSGKLAISTSGAWQPLAAGTALNPFRLYLSMENRDDSPVKVDQSAISRMRIVERGESTGMEQVVPTKPRETVIYDLSGRRVMHPVKGGVYIVNGKKRIF